MNNTWVVAHQPENGVFYPADVMAQYGLTQNVDEGDELHAVDSFTLEATIYLVVAKHADGACDVEEIGKDTSWTKSDEWLLPETGDEPACVCPKLALFGHSPDCGWKVWNDAQKK